MDITGTGRTGSSPPSGDILTHPSPGRRYLTTCKRSDALTLLRAYALELRSRGLAGIWGVECGPPRKGHRGGTLYVTPHSTDTTGAEAER